MSARSLGEQMRHRVPVVLVFFAANRILERRRPVGRMIVGQLERRRLPADTPHLVADAVDDGLPQIRLHRSHMPWLERGQVPEHMQRRLLHQVARIETAACGSGQSAMRPSLQRRETPLEQGLHRRPVSAACPHHQLDGRFVAQERIAGGSGADARLFSTMTGAGRIMSFSRLEANFLGFLR